MLNEHPQKIILILLPVWGYLGGAETRAYRMALDFKKREYEIIFCILFKGNSADPASGVLKGLLNKEGFSSISLELESWLEITSFIEFRLHKSLYLEICKLSPDIVLSFTNHSNVIGAFCWRLWGAKSFIWNQADAGIYLLENSLQKRAIKKTPILVANSFSGVNFLKEEYRNTDVHLIRNNINFPLPEKERNVWRSELKFQESDFLVVMIGNITPEKDHYSLLLAWTSYRSLGGKGELLLAGYKVDCELFESLQTLTKTQGIEDSVHFLGRVEDVSGLLIACDLCIFSSISEGNPNGILQAMALGMPVIAKDCLGVGEIWDEYDYPYIFKADKLEAMGQAILTMELSSEKRHEAGAINLAIIKNEYSYEQTQGRYVKLIEKALHQRRFLFSFLTIRLLIIFILSQVNRVSFRLRRVLHDRKIFFIKRLKPLRFQPFNEK